MAAIRLPVEKRLCLPVVGMEMSLLTAAGFECMVRMLGSSVDSGNA